MDKFTEAYITAALWSSTDDDGQPLDSQYSVLDIAPETLARFEADCAKFQRQTAELISERHERAGHDFWLTRNGHGAGFWDGDWPPVDGEALTRIAKAYGECDLYVGDDGRLYA